MSAKPALLAILLAAPLVAALAPGGAPLASAAPEGSPEEEVHLACVAVASPRPETRAEGLGRLRAVLVAHPELAPRALPAVREVLRLRGPEDRSRAVALLSSVDHAETRRLWLERLDPSEDDRVLEAAVAGGDRGAYPEAELALAERVRRAATPLHRALALEALGGHGGPVARLLLTTPRPGAGWVEESCRALGLGRQPREVAVPALLPLLEHEDVAPRAHAWEALVHLSGRNLPPTRSAWEAWWNGGRPEAEPPAPPAAPGARYEAPEPAHVPTYYGVRLARPRTRVAFCIDMSSSMWGEPTDRARATLARTIREMPTTYAFDVIAFHENVMPWGDRLVRAHPVQKHKAIEWIHSFETVSYTNIYDAVASAFRYGDGARLDAVFLLSDGAANRGRHRRPDDVVEAIAELSRRRVPVHTIGVGEEAFPLLRRIATATGGLFIDAFDH
jgi:hypothetical protein